MPFRPPVVRRAPAAPLPAVVSKMLATDPLRAVDVGAARGVPDHWLPHLEHLRVDAFEPDATECARLAARSHPNVQWHAKALAGGEGPRDLHVLATPTGSSFFPPHPVFVEMFGLPSYSDVVAVETLQCTTLARHLDATGGPGLDLIKLDTQGSELEILRGLRSEQLSEVTAIEIEVELHEAYAGQPLFPEVHAFLQENGFSLLDFRVQRAHLTGGVEERHYLRRHLRTAIGRRDVTAQAHALDALYVRPMRQVLAAGTPRSLVRLATIFQIYRYVDGIFWLLDQPRTAEVLGAEAVRDMVATYEAAGPRPRLLERAGKVPHLLRRARRATSFVLEQSLGVEGFDPPRTAWTHTYWPDS